MRPVRRIPIGGCTVRVILITHAFRFRTFPDRLVGLPALLGIINDLPVILQLLRTSRVSNPMVRCIGDLHTWRGNSRITQSGAMLAPKAPKHKGRNHASASLQDLDGTKKSRPSSRVAHW